MYILLRTDLTDLTGNDDKSLKGESLVCFNFRTINTMKIQLNYLGKILEDITCIFRPICFVI